MASANTVVHTYTSGSVEWGPFGLTVTEFTVSASPESAQPAAEGLVVFLPYGRVLRVVSKADHEGEVAK